MPCISCFMLHHCAPFFMPVPRHLHPKLPVMKFEINETRDEAKHVNKSSSWLMLAVAVMVHSSSDASRSAWCCTMSASMNESNFSPPRTAAIPCSVTPTRWSVTLP